jgi:hypothetical protein
MSNITINDRPIARQDQERQPALKHCQMKQVPANRQTQNNAIITGRFQRQSTNTLEPLEHCSHNHKNNDCICAVRLNSPTGLLSINEADQLYEQLRSRPTSQMRVA